MKCVKDQIHSIHGYAACSLVISNKVDIDRMNLQVEVMFQLLYFSHVCNHLPLLKLLMRFFHPYMIHRQFTSIVNNCIISCYNGVDWEESIVARSQL